LVALAAAELPTAGRCRVEIVLPGEAADEDSYDDAGCEIQQIDALGPDAELLSYEVSFDVPRVDAGEYLLRVMTRPPGGEPSRSRAVGALVLDGGTRDRDLLWTDLRWREPAQADEEGADSSTRKRAGPRRVRESYAAALATLSSDGPVAARAAILEMESAVLGKASDKAFRNLTEAERWVAEELARADVEVLVPLFVLHTELYRTYVDRRVFSLAAHSKATEVAVRPSSIFTNIFLGIVAPPP